MALIFKQCHRTNYKAGRTELIKYIVIHYTGNNGDTAKNNINYYADTANINASAHYYVDEYADIYQSVKDSDTAWHCGGAPNGKYLHPDCRNANSISIEMCPRNPNGKVGASDFGWYFKPETVENAVNLTKELMERYNIPIENVIRHYDVWGKICPAPFVNNPAQWEDFKNRLTGDELTMSQYEELRSAIEDANKTASQICERLGKIENQRIYNYIDENMPTWAHEAVQWCVEKGIILGTGDGLGLNDQKLWDCVTMYRLAKVVAEV